MQEQVAHETGIPAFDFGEIWEGWQSHQQMVHPLLVSFWILSSSLELQLTRFPLLLLILVSTTSLLPSIAPPRLQYPGGPVFAQALIHHIWMESVGRDSWRLSKRRPLTAINKVDIDALDS